MNTVIQPSRKAKNSLVYIYLMMMSSLFLFYFQNYFYNITDAKYRFFFYVSGVCIIGYLLITIWGWFCDDRKSTDTWKDRLQAFLKQFSISDYIALAMLCSYTITTLLSSNPSDSFTGLQGRHLGLLFSYMVISLYFMISRSYELQQSVILTLLGSISLVFLLGLLNFFYIDPFGFYEYLSDYQGNLFLSTMGNIDFYGILVCFSLPLSLILYCYSEQSLSKGIYLFTLLCSGIGLVTCNSDSAYMATIILLMLSSLYLSKEYKTWLRFLQGCLVLFGSARILYYVILFTGEACRDIHTLSLQFSGGMINWLILGFCIVSYVYCFREKEYLQRYWNVKRIRAWLGTIFGISVTALIILVIYVSFIHTDLPLGTLENYLRFSPDWGTGRGETWMVLLNQFKGFNLIELLFGYGLDMTSSLTSVMDSAMNYDNAHNEYLQYLVTSGILGLLLYMAFCGSVLVRLYHSSKDEPFGIALCCIIVIYMAQAFFNLNQPMTTPLFFIILGMAEAFQRHVANKPMEAELPAEEPTSKNQSVKKRKKKK